MIELVKVTELKAMPDHRLWVRFSDDTEGIRDCRDLLAQSGPIAEQLKDPEYFARVFLEYGAPTWPKSYDLCPDRLRMEMENAGEIKKPVAAE